MKHIQSAYGRVLYPGRYTTRVRHAAGETPALPPGGIELDLAAAVYGLISRLEGVVDAIRGRHAGRRRSERVRATPRPLGCG